MMWTDSKSAAVDLRWQLDGRTSYTDIGAGRDPAYAHQVRSRVSLGHMVSSDASTVEAYLDEVPADRRPDVEAVRNMILEHLPDGYVEVMRWGMITYEVPLATFSETYNGKPLMLAALASQKRHLSLYLTNVAFVPGGEEAFRAAYLQTGKSLDMGRSCVRFKKAEDLALDVIAASISEMALDRFVEGYKASRSGR